MALIFGTCNSFSQESKNKTSTGHDLQTLQQLIEQQSKQIATLTEQVAHLTQLIESQQHGLPAPASSPAPAHPAAPTEPTVAAAAAATPVEAGNSHVVSKGETLTSIAKHYKITVGELLKVNKIENDRMLQIGQTLVIPTPTPLPNPQEKKETQ